MSAQTATIVRSKHNKENKYFMMRKETAQNKNLSFEARGLLCYLLSMPDDWEIQVNDLKQQCGRAKVYSMLEELKNAKFLKEREKYQDEKGHWQWTAYVLYELPIADKVEEKIIPMPEQSPTVSHKPEHGEPNTENREIKELNTELQNTETKKEYGASAADTLEEEKSLTTGKTPKSRQANRIFNGIAFTAFDIDTRNPDYQRLIDDKDFGGRIGRIEKRLKKAYPDVTAEDIYGFFKYYKGKFPSADVPRDPDKYIEHFVSYKNQAPVTNIVSYHANAAASVLESVTDEERAAAAAIFQANRKKTG